MVPLDGPPITVMIPLGGLGSRFQKEGYTRPKPFVQVMGKPMILWVLDSLKLRPQDELVIVYNPDFLSRKYWPIVTATYPRLRFVELPGPTRGAAETVMIGLRGINATLRAQPVMLVDGDAFYDQDIVSMYREVASKGANGVFYFEDTQPKPMYSYIVFDPSSRRISQVKEKVKISDYANSGCYCFASGVELEKQCCALLDSGSTQLSQDKVGEYYKVHHDQNSGLFTPQGARLYTFFMYLSTPEAGGGTRFADLKETVPAVKGSVVLWPSVMDSDPDVDEPMTHHEGLPPERGIKYAANVWVHVYDYKSPASQGCPMSFRNTH